MKRKFWSYVLPSMISFLVTGIYVSVDGFFIGRAVGDMGLASINIAWPLGALILSIGTGIGMGGAVNISNHMGAGEKERADKAFGNTLVLLLLSSVILTLFLLIFGKALLQLMGAEGEMLELSTSYLQILAYGAILQVFATGITPLLRNQEKTSLAMVLTITNFVIDTILSGVFVLILGFGVKGAAFATLIGQFVAVIPALLILFRKEGRIPTSYFRLKKETVQHIIRVGAPVMWLSFIPSFTILIINRQAVIYGGTTALAAFAVVSYILPIGQCLLQGVGEGSQPLISFYHGAKDKHTVTLLRRWTYLTAFIISLVITLGIIIFQNVIPVLFNVSTETTTALQLALPLCSLSLPLHAFSRVTTEYFNAIKKSHYASIMVYGEALLILPVCAFLLPLVFRINGVWSAVVMVQFLLALAGGFLVKQS